MPERTRWPTIHSNSVFSRLYLFFQKNSQSPRSSFQHLPCAAILPIPLVVQRLHYPWSIGFRRDARLYKKDKSTSLTQYKQQYSLESADRLMGSVNQLNHQRARWYRVPYYKLYKTCARTCSVDFKSCIKPRYDPPLAQSFCSSFPFQGTHYLWNTFLALQWKR